MTPDLYIIDDPIRDTPAPSQSAIRAAFDATFGPVLRSGSYVNRFGETITWEAGANWTALHTPWSERDWTK